MNPQRIRLVLAALLFAVWMGYLLYLVFTLPRSPERSAHRVVAAADSGVEVDVVGTINLKDGTVKVEEVLYPPKAKKPEKGEEIKVTNLAK